MGVSPHAPTYASCVREAGAIVSSIILATSFLQREIYRGIKRYVLICLFGSFPISSEIAAAFNHYQNRVTRGIIAFRLYLVLPDIPIHSSFGYFIQLSLTLQSKGFRHNDALTGYYTQGSSVQLIDYG